VTGKLPARGHYSEAQFLEIARDQYSHVCYNQFMRTVNISDLKARLSAHLQHVRDGEELLVCDRNKPVARIVPCSASDQPERERRLIARGILTPPKKKRRSSLPPPAGNVSDEVMERIWREEREGR
jgi:prevent-host-death family protein